MPISSCRAVTRGPAAALAAAALAVTLVAPASAEPTDQTSTSTEESSTDAPGEGTTPTDGSSSTDAWGSDGSTQEPDSDEPLSEADVEGQVAEAEALADKLLNDNADIKAAVEELKRHSARANRLLQDYAAARDEYDEAKGEADEADAKLKQLQKRLSEGRKDLRKWAFDTYTEAGGYTDTMALIDTLSKRPENAGNSAGDLSYLTDNRVRTVDMVREDKETQASLTEAKEKAQKRASTAKAKAKKAKDSADAAVQQRKVRLSALRKEHAKELREAGPVVQALLGVDSPSAQDASARLQDAMSELGQDISEFEGGKPCSNNNDTYPNGQAPPSALCPLIGEPGESLRPRAAAAFNAMSRAYQRDTGNLICVTDSYRSYSEQVLVKQQRGGWAATPGKSNHGLGLALDLCGGINSFGSAAHLWMQQNAPSYGWFHPDWAAAGGSLPEPWHWEFGG